MPKHAIQPPLELPHGRTQVRSYSRNRHAIRLLSAVCRMIRQGAIVAGERLPAQRNLSRQLHISAEAVERGIRCLAMLGVVNVNSRVGASVAPGALGLLSADSRSAQGPASWDLDQIHGIRAMLGGYAAGVAARRFDWKARVKLAEELAELYRATGNGEEYRRHETEFQKIIARTIRNRTLCGLLLRINCAANAAVYPGAAQGELLRSAERYRRVFLAIRDRNPKEACRAMEDHLQAGHIQDRQINDSGIV